MFFIKHFILFFRKNSFIIVLLFLSHSKIYAQTPEEQKQLEQFREAVNKLVVFKNINPLPVKITADINYRQPAAAYSTLDIYQPEGETKKLPLVIFIHGKTPIKTDPRSWGSYKSWAELTAGKGFVSITYTHRLAIPGGSLEEAGNDLSAVLKYVHSNQNRFTIDTSRIAVVAYSAGVPLLSEVSLRKMNNIKCIGAFYGFMDLATIGMFKNESTSHAKNYSLVTHVKSLPPLFIARAGKEHNQGLNESIGVFVSEAMQQNIPLTLVNHPGGVHGFDTQNDDDRSKEIIESLLLFLNYHLQ
ncbi:MAG TPA: alpha/beta hydrolase [Cyclobacteriaceae bacterium]